MPTITVNLESGDPPASITLLALFDVTLGTTPAGVTLPATFTGTGPWEFTFNGTATRYVGTYSLNYSDGPSSNETFSVAGDTTPPGGVTTVEGAIVSLLAANAGVAAITAQFIPFSDMANVGFPKLTYWRWDTDRSAESGGFTNDGPTGKGIAKLFLDAWAVDLLTAKRLAAAVRKALNGYSGSIGGFSIEQVYIKSERDTTAADQLVPGKSKPVQRVTLDVRVMFTDT